MVFLMAMHYRGGAAEKETADQGTVDFQNLKLGVYLVEETKTPAEHVGSAPFLVFLPMSVGTNSGAATEWNYDIHVYPKNTKTKVEKKVVDAGKHLGDNISYSVETDVPKLLNTEFLNFFSVSDKFSANKLNPNKDQVEVVVDTDSDAANGDDLKLQKDVDFKVTEHDGVTYVALTKAGLAKVSTQKYQGKKIRVTFKEVSVTATEDNGSVKNGGDGTDHPTKVTFGKDKLPGNTPPPDGENPPPVPNEPPDPQTPPPGTPEIPSNEVESKFAKIRIHKIDPEITDGDNGLNDAKFKLYTCTRQDQATPVLVGDALTVNGKNEWSTAEGPKVGAAGNEKGVVTIEGIHVSDFVNGVQVTQDQANYCLVETQAPNGYSLNPEPIWVGPLTANEWATPKAVEVENIKDDNFELPTTGGAGIALFGVAGVVIIGLGVFAARRRNSESEAA